MENKTELTVKTCPCCGQTAILATYKEEGEPVSGWAYRCSDVTCCLGYVFNWEDSPEEAIKEWNALSDKKVTITVEMDDETDKYVSEKSAELGVSHE